MWNSVHPTPYDKTVYQPVEAGGTLQLGPFNFDSNSYQDFKVALAIGHGALPKDWSFVAWGENGPVYVYNQNGSATSNFAMGVNGSRATQPGKPTNWEQTKPKKNDLKQPKPDGNTFIPAPPAPAVPRKYDPVKEWHSWIEEQNNEPDRKGLAMVAEDELNEHDGSRFAVFKNQSSAAK